MQTLRCALALAALALLAACPRSETPDARPDPAPAPPPTAERTQPKDLTTDTDSRNLASAEERVAFALRYIAAPTPPRDVEFTILYRDNRGGLVSGPSDWRIEMVLAVAPGEVPTWVARWKPCPDGVAEPAWSRALLSRRDDWRPTSEQRCYRFRAGTAWVHDREGLILYRSVSDPAMN
ncbi:MAG: hypothetical protein AAGC55_31970, partial [Myxococcota bacterium]